MCGIAGLHQSHQWQWRILWLDGVEPFLIYCVGFYFKWIQPSFFSFRLLPVIISILTCVAAYWGARQYFSKSISFLISWLFAFSFWQLMLSRDCLIPIPLPLLQCLCLGFLGLFLKYRGQKGTPFKSLWALSIIAGIGFYSWMSWLAAWLSIALIVFIHALTPKRKETWPILWIFFGTTALLIWPLFIVRVSPGGTHILSEHFNSSSIKPLFHYLIGLFWHGAECFPFGPNWGGFLNPILGSLTLIGFLHLIQTASKRFIGAMVACLCISLIPGVFTIDFEVLRILPLLPFLMVLAAWGIHCLGSSGRVPWRFTAIALLVFGSFVLDAYNYVNHYCSLRGVPPDRQWRSVQYYDAYRTIDQFQRESGPLYVFSEFNTDYANKNLNIACYPFDALQNPNLSKVLPRWAAIIVNAQYAPFLIRNYKGLKFKVLKTDKHEPDDWPPFGMFLIPVSQIPNKVLTHWIQADRVYRELNFEAQNINLSESWGKFSESLSSQKNQAMGDEFLAAVYWEKIAFFHFLAGDFKIAAQAYQNAIHDGFPAAHLYYDLGISLKSMGKIKEGQKALDKAEALSKQTSF